MIGIFTEIAPATNPSLSDLVGLQGVGRTYQQELSCMNVRTGRQLWAIGTRKTLLLLNS
jgi:hypothetical protein